MVGGTHKAYLSLGGNLGDRETLLREAVRLIGERCGLVGAVSSFIETEPVGFVSTHPFLNLALELDTPLSPEELLPETQAIEKELGRTAKSAGGIYHDRPIDIDIILFGNLQIDTPELTIPHPRFRERLFVLTPLSEIAGEVKDPLTHKTIKELLWDAS